MLTVDEQFEAIVADVSPSAKMRPFQEPDPEKGSPTEGVPEEEAPTEETPGESK
jgi:hypothetical protein